MAAAENNHFKSLVESVDSTDDIYELTVATFECQHLFDKSVSPLEQHEWDDDQLADFHIDHEQIDRLYYYKQSWADTTVTTYKLLVRMEYSADMYKRAYISVSCNMDASINDVEPSIRGDIYVTFDPQIFLHSAVLSDQGPHEIWKFMREDGLDVKDPTTTVEDLLANVSLYNNDFKTLNDRVQDAADIDRMVGEALRYQISKRASPYEISEWSKGELEDFKIKIEEIDRLYYIDVSDSDDGGDTQFEMLARMRYGFKRSIRRAYIHLRATSDRSIPQRGGGELYVVFDPQNFFKSIVQTRLTKDLCYTVGKQMVEDNLEVKWEQQIMPSTLKQECLECVCKENPDEWGKLPKLFIPELEKLAGENETKAHFIHCDEYPEQPSYGCSTLKRKERSVSTTE